MCVYIYIYIYIYIYGMFKCQMNAFLKLNAFFKCLTADSFLTNK